MEAKLLEWLDKQGYPLEMKVAKLFMEKGFHVTHSPYYLDEESSSRREIDLIATAPLKQNDTLVNFKFVIECKNNNDKPWVAFCSENHRLHEKAFIVQKCATQGGRKFLDQLVENKTDFDGVLFNQPKRPSYNITQAFDNKSDSVYAAIYTVSKASWSMIKPDLQRVGAINIAIPFIVIGGRLFESYLNESGEYEVNEVTRSTLIWKNPMVGMPHTTILVETFKNLGTSLDIIRSELKETYIINKDFFTNPYFQF